MTTVSAAPAVNEKVQAATPIPSAEAPFMLPGEHIRHENRLPGRYIAWSLAVGIVPGTMLAVFVWVMMHALRPFFPAEGATGEVVALLDTRLDEAIATAIFILTTVPASIRRFFRLRRSRSTVTTSHAYSWGVGRWSSEVNTIAIANVTGVRIQRGFAERMAGVWTVTADTDGSGITLRGVERPHEVRALLERQPHEIMVIADHKPAAQEEVRPRSERVVWEGKALKRALLWPLLTQGGFAIAAIARPDMLILFGAEEWARVAVVIGIVIAVSVMIYAAGLWTGCYMVYDDRIVRRSGIINRSEHEMYIRSISDVRLKHPVAGRVLGYGELSVLSTSGDTIELRGVRDPEGVRAHIEKLRHGGE